MTLTALTSTVLPLEIHGHPGAAEAGGGGGFLDLLLGFGGLLLVLALLAAGFLLLRRYGILPQTLPFARRTSPEDNARQILAERMANGDVSTEEFMERASVLNWTPGATAAPPRKRKSRS